MSTTAARNQHAHPTQRQTKACTPARLEAPLARSGLLSPLPPLSARMHKLLVLGDQEAAYARGNLQRGGKNTATSDHAWAVTRALAADAVRAGWNRAAFVQVMLDGPYKAGQHARTLQHRRGYDKAAAWLQRAWDGAEQYVHSTDPVATRRDFHAALAALRSRIECTPWKGIAAKTDLRNLIARMDICSRAGSWVHTVSERDLAERMGCSRTTAHNSNQRLLAAKMLRQLDNGSPTEGARWMLISRLPSLTSHHWSTPKGPQAGGAMSGPAVRQADTEANLDSRTASRLMRLDAFAHHGLGGSGLSILSSLAERDGQSRTELQASASISRPTAYRQLGTLKELGLVRQEGELYHLSPAALKGTGAPTQHCTDPVASWTETAERLGTAGVAERRRRHHEVQRAHWRVAQVRLAERRRAPKQPTLPHPSVALPQHVRADGCAIDPISGEVIAGLYVAEDGRWLWS
ncbi:helix-turn-helix domain-containing protein [Streptomyces nigra]|uniref:helix-turn-helix domain-containing protein n=1 Tax=Streptomyces nigra TaxID=1827580 RepID=UPI0037F8F648